MYLLDCRTGELLGSLGSQYGALGLLEEMTLQTLKLQWVSCEVGAGWNRLGAAASSQRMPLQQLVHPSPSFPLHVMPVLMEETPPHARGNQLPCPEVSGSGKLSLAPECARTPPRSQAGISPFKG